MATKHTPGPWVYAEGQILKTISVDSAVIICDPTQSTALSLNAANANYKLMAAAPDLLECVFDALSDLRGYMSVGMILSFQNAIKKATE